MLTNAFLPMPCNCRISASVNRLKSSAFSMPAAFNALSAGCASLNGGRGGSLLTTDVDGTL